MAGKGDKRRVAHILCAVMVIVMYFANVVHVTEVAANSLNERIIGMPRRHLQGSSLRNPPPRSEMSWILIWSVCVSPFVV